MSSANPFPARPQPSLVWDDVVGYLSACMANGHTVYRGEYDHSFILDLQDYQIIILEVAPGGGRWQVRWENLGVTKGGVTAETLPQLEEAIARAASDYGKVWPCCPTSGRLSPATPATNYRTISNLVGSSKLEAVFDPYLANSSLTEIINILSFGSGSVSNGVRLLGSTEKTQGPVPQFSKAGVAAWLKQLGVTGEARVYPKKPHDHRRFLLLSGGQCLILGPSLNAIHKNEATHVEQDAADRTFFDSMWATASPL